MACFLIYENEIGGSDIRNLRFATLADAQRYLQRLKIAFETECEEASFLDCISVEADTQNHYKATDGEDWVEIRVLIEPHRM